MSSAAVRRLRDVGMTDAAEVGGKAASLGELLAAGVRVPNGVVLTAAAADMTADERRSLLRAAAGDMGIGPFAVRSSGIAENGAQHSYAGIFESVLNVTADDLPAAVDRCLASAHAPRAATYECAGTVRMAVIIQRMVAAAAAGVALSADPITGDRRTCVVTAIRGAGERLVSGAALGDEWTVRDGAAIVRRRPEAAIGRRQAIRVARQARRIADARGTPQDIEWATDADGTPWILQARPMTALPPDVSWEARARGAYTRTLRFGEWISEPVTPLFESWLLTAMEERLHARLKEWIGQRAPRPHHVVVNGWYFYSINWLSPSALARSLPGILWHLVRSPRRVAGLIPATVRHSVPVFEREWREDLLPRYRGAVARAEGRVETVPVTELPALIDELADLAGDYFASIAALTGAAYKMEMNLARFHRRHLRNSPGGSHLPLLGGFDPPGDPEPHAVVSLDWWHPPLSYPPMTTRPAEDHGRLVAARRAVEQAAFRALASSPRRLRAFDRLLAETQRLVPLREEQVRELTIAWPVMRRGLLRIGEALSARGVIAEPDDVFFLTRPEALSALGEGDPSTIVGVSGRRSTREEQARLVPPLVVGRVNRMLRWYWESFPRFFGGSRSDHALVSGSPASPGRATGPVRVVRGPHQFDELQRGEILVAPLTAPAWTPLFTRAAAVVTDVGSAASHASIIAREYGIPAVVGCGDATARLRTGIRVTVDGGTGNVEPE
jgi:phosphohistidine swiveling domain-containing protein